MNMRFYAVLAVIGIGIATSGCQSSDPAGVLNIGKKKEQAPDERITQEEVRAYCPDVTLREGTAYFSDYGKKAEKAPENLIYQASIEDVTRSCSYSDTAITMNVAVAGKVVPGPKGKAGDITMPIRIAVTQGGELVYSQLHQYTVAVSPSGATQFIFNDPSVVINGPIKRNIVVFAGYDEGPYKTP